MIRDYSDQFLADLEQAIDFGLQVASLEGADSAALSMKSAPGIEGSKL